MPFAPVPSEPLQKSISIGSRQAADAAPGGSSMKRAIVALARYAAVVSLTAVLAACGASALPAPSAVAQTSNPSTSPASQAPSAPAESAAALAGAPDHRHLDLRSPA